MSDRSVAISFLFPKKYLMGGHNQEKDSPLETYANQPYFW